MHSPHGSDGAPTGLRHVAPRPVADLKRRRADGLDFRESVTIRQGPDRSGSEAERHMTTGVTSRAGRDGDRRLASGDPRH